MTPQQRDAHMRLARLPRRVHERKTKDMAAVHQATAEAAARTRRVNGTDFKQSDSWVRFGGGRYA